MAAKNTPVENSAHTAGRSKKNEITVHLLYAGRTFCGMTGTPNTWPATEKWIGIDQKDLATCKTCLSNFEKTNKGKKICR
jgi:hypothetical protein